jgi:hypothetical protein
MTNRKKRNRHSFLSSSAHYDECGPVGPQGIRVAAVLFSRRMAISFSL